MSTSAAYGFISGGIEYITYSHCDGYPNGLGVDLLQGLKGLTLEKMIKTVNSLITIDKQASKESIVDQHIINELKEFHMNVSTGHDWYAHLRGSQGQIQYYFRENNPLRYIIDNKLFLYSSTFCEYAYIFNLDTGKVEFYKGFNDDYNAAGRYANTPSQYRYDNNCAGVRLLGELPIYPFFDMSIEEIVQICDSVQKFAYNDYEEIKVEFPSVKYQEQLKLI